MNSSLSTVKITELPDGPFRKKWYHKRFAFVCLMSVGEVVSLIFFDVLLKVPLTRSYVPNFQGHTMHRFEMVAV